MLKEALGVWEDWGIGSVGNTGSVGEIKNIYPYHYHAGLPSG
ncbi:hypothetical protein [Okeania sp. SIO2C2]|nr:hypothetical protein [Okeania sp. SIO2C2]